MKRFISSSLAALALTGFSANHASADCQYQVTSDWGGGFLGQVTYTNDTDTPLDNWSFDMTFANSMVNSAWGDANWQGANPTTISAPSWNPVLQPGQTQNMYFVAQSLDGSGGETPVLDGEPCGESHILFSENFEETDIGDIPSGWSTNLGYGQINSQPSGNSSALVDDSRANFGSQSILIKTSNQMAPHFLFKELPKDLSALYVRAYVYAPDQIGGGAEGGAGDHAHLIGTTATPGGDQGEELRFGSVARSNIGGFMPKNADSFTNIQTTEFIPANTWTCVEWAVEKNAAFDRMSGWINDQLVFEATQQSDWQNGPSGSFINNNSLATVNFGWRKFGTGADIPEIWFDDIVVATERVSCN